MDAGAPSAPPRRSPTGRRSRPVLRVLLVWLLTAGTLLALSAVLTDVLV
jgi:hypothetical protein